MYNCGEKYKALCEAQCRRFNVYADIYDKSVDNGGNIIYIFKKGISSHGSKESIISVKLVRGQTTGGFSFGNCYGGEMTLVVTPETDISNSETKIVISVTFIDENGFETEKNSIGVFFVESISKSQYSKTVKGVDAITFLSKYYDNISAPNPLKRLFYYCTRFAKLETEDQNFINNPVVSELPKKGEDDNGKSIYYTCREVCNFIASANAGNVFANAKGKIQIAIPDFANKHNIPFKSVIKYTDGFTENRFTKTFWAATYEGAEMPEVLDPLSGKYDPNIMVINFPLIVDNTLTPAQMQKNIDDVISGFKYNGISIKKQGTGLYEIGDVLSFTDPETQKIFENILVMGIVYEISPKNGFTETIYSLGKTESQKQTEGISLKKEVDEVSQDVEHVRKDVLNVKNEISAFADNSVGQFTDEEKTSEIFNDYDNNQIDASTMFAHVAGSENGIDTANDVSQISKSATIAGGKTNKIDNSPFAFVGSGQGNRIKSGESASVLCGNGNNVNNASSLVACGNGNAINGKSSVICGGNGNIVNSGSSAIVSGEYNNSSMDYSAVLTGTNNRSEGSFSAVICGKSNSITSDGNEPACCCIVAGTSNYVGRSPKANNAILTGKNNQILLSSVCSSIITGENNSVENSTGSVIVAGLENSIIDVNYAAILCGINNNVRGENSSTCGHTNNVYAKDSFVLGNNNDVPDDGIRGKIILGSFYDSAPILNSPPIIFAIGNGSTNNKSNCFWIDADGNVYAKSFHNLAVTKEGDDDLSAKVSKMEAEIKKLKEEIESLKGA